MSQTFPLTLFFDGACDLCRNEMAWLRRRDVHARLHFEDIARPGFDGFPPGTDMAALMKQMHAQAADGTVFRGVDVFRLAYFAVGIPAVARLTELPGIRWLSEHLYPPIARYRYHLPVAPLRKLHGWGARLGAWRRGGATCAGEHCAMAAHKEITGEKTS